MIHIIKVHENVKFVLPDSFAEILIFFSYASI